jgi:hypothetical protein
MLESNNEWATTAGRTVAEGWHEDPHFAEDPRAWFAAVGPWALGVYEHADGRVTWGVKGPDVGCEDVDVGGTAGSVAEAMRAAGSCGEWVLTQGATRRGLHCGRRDESPPSVCDSTDSSRVSRHAHQAN